MAPQPLNLTAIRTGLRAWLNPDNGNIDWTTYRQLNNPTPTFSDRIVVNEDMLPSVSCDLLEPGRQRLDRAHAERTVLYWESRWLIRLAAIGGDMDEADARVFGMLDALQQSFKSTGAFFGLDRGAIDYSHIESAGWSLESRDETISVLDVFLVTGRRTT